MCCHNICPEINFGNTQFDITRHESFSSSPFKQSTVAHTMVTWRDPCQRLPGLLRPIVASLPNPFRWSRHLMCVQGVRIIYGRACIYSQMHPVTKCLRNIYDGWTCFRERGKGLRCLRNELCRTRNSFSHRWQSAVFSHSAEFTCLCCWRRLMSSLCGVVKSNCPDRIWSSAPNSHSFKFNYANVII